MVAIENSNGQIIVKSDMYCLKYDKENPCFISVESNDGGIKADLFIPSGFNTTEGSDITESVSEPSVTRESGCVELCFTVKSRIWQEKKCIFRCGGQILEYYTQIDGEGSLDEGNFFQGYTAFTIAQEDGPQLDYRSKKPASVAGAFTQASVPGFKTIFNPQPNHEMKQHFWFGEYSVLLGSSDSSYLGHQFHGGCWQLVPSPLCYAVSGEDTDHWMTLGLGVKPGQYNFTAYEYIGGLTFGLNLAYEGHTRVKGNWESPHIIFSFAEGEYEALEKYVSVLHDRGYVHFPERKAADWWKRPIVCGWGYECYVRTQLTTVPPPHYATQSNYEHIAGVLEKQGIKPGMLVIDDKWQTYYGDPYPDIGKWLDMRGFIESQHKKDIRVLLWLKFWDCEGVPAVECVTDENGNAVTVDPSNPAYEKRLRAAIRNMLSSEEGCLNADGFKLDSICCTPTGKKLKAYGEIWGIELLKKLYDIIYDEAKKVKPDAYIMAHSPNPYFADVIDVLRLNDIHHADEQIIKRMTHRAKIARIACPDWLIDTDNWPIPNRKTWMEYMRKQPELGIPSLYYIDYIDISGEKITEEDYKEIRQIWDGYEKEIKK
ncbi:MAG: hypothetical protein FIA99_16625 [Ruminiclostridium sp.]|nr:hypothetical protein [Ruminiclostridium sp.]